MEISYSSHSHLIIPSIRLTPSASGGRTFFLSFLRIVGKSTHFFRLPMPLKKKKTRQSCTIWHQSLVNVSGSSTIFSNLQTPNPKKIGDLDPTIFNNLAPIFSDRLESLTISCQSLATALGSCTMFTQSSAKNLSFFARNWRNYGKIFNLLFLTHRSFCCWPHGH